MKYFTFLAALVLLFTWTACGDGSQADTTSTTETPGVVTPVNSTVQPQTVPVNIDANKNPTTTISQPVTTIPTTNPTGIATIGLNPAHGQPGHRCDIAVGAPLNSSPVQQPVSTTTTTTPVTVPTNQVMQPVATTTVAPGMNPAHGQPNHRCDIPVGAPLNSKPVNTAATTPVTVPTNQVVQPVATTIVAPGMNPAHGQPGHRCDIAVGAPLNSKPIQTTVTPQTDISTQAAPLVTPVKPIADTSRQKQ